MSLSSISGRSGVVSLFAAAIGIALSLLAWSAASEREDRIAELEFKSRATGHATILQSGINEYTDSLSALRALFESADHQITRHEFSAFAARLLQNRSAILEAAWVCA